MSQFASRIEEAKRLWFKIAVTPEERAKTIKLFELLAHKMEAKYSQLYSAVHGKSHIMTRVLLDKCKKQQLELQLWCKP